MKKPHTVKLHRPALSLCARILFVLACQAGFVGHANSDDGVTLPQITVWPNSVDQLLGRPPVSPIDAIDLGEPDLERAHERTIDEVLRGLPGVSVTKGGAFGVGLMQVRGASGQGLINLDGLPVPDSVPGIVNVTALLPDGLENIQLNRGFEPAHRTFKSLGGSIDLTARSAVDDSVDFRLEGGTFGLLKETLRTNLTSDRARVALTVNRSDAFDGAYHAQEANGNPERDPFYGTQALIKSDLKVSDRIATEASLFYRDSWNAIDAFGLRDGVFTYIDHSHAFFKEESWMAQNRWSLRVNDGFVSQLQFGYTHHRNRSSTQGLNLGYTADLYLARWENRQILWQDAKHRTLQLIWGAEGRHESAYAPTIRQPAPGLFVPGPSFAEERNQEAGFVETRLNAGSVDGGVGVRYESYSRFGSHPLFQANANWRFRPEWTVHAKGGNGFRIPSYAEKLFPLLGNPNLQPERAAGGDLGLTFQPTAKIKLDVTGYYNRYDHLILISWQPLPTPALPCLGQCASNLANATVAGLETSGEIQFNEAWQGGLSYTFTDSQNLANGLEIPLRAKNSARAWVEWRVPALPLTLWAEGLCRGRSFNDLDNNLPIDHVFRLNLHADYKVSNRFELYVRGENLANDRTPDFFGLDWPGAMVYGGFVVKL